MPLQLHFGALLCASMLQILHLYDKATLAACCRYCNCMLQLLQLLHSHATATQCWCCSSTSCCRYCSRMLLQPHFGALLYISMLKLLHLHNKSAATAYCRYCKCSCILQLFQLLHSHATPSKSILQPLSISACCSSCNCLLQLLQLHAANACCTCMLHLRAVAACCRYMRKLHAANCMLRTACCDCML